jgi:hypothetical protein
MDTGNYNSVGISQTGPAMNQSPSSNPGIVYQPANTPTNPGSLKVATQYFANVTVFSKDGGKVDIGTQNIAQPGIVIYDADGNVVFSFIAGIGVTTDSNSALPSIIATNTATGLAGYFSDGGLGTDNVVEIAITNASNTNAPLQIANAKIYNSYFRKMMNLQAGSGGVTIWTGDGSHTPNAVLSGSLGDFLIGGPGGHPFYCTGTTNWTQI